MGKHATANPLTIAKRRRFQFGLRAILILTLLVGLGLSWQLKRRAIAERRERVESVIERATWRVRRPPVDQPAWRGLLWGDDWPSYVLDLGRVNVGSDAELAAVCTLTRLERLDLVSHAITPPVLDAALLSDMRNLKEVSLDSDLATEPNVKALAALPRLETLELCDSIVLDSLLANLQGLKSLKVLRLRNAEIGSAELGGLRQLPEFIEELDLSVTGFSDLEFAALAAIPQLRSLDISYLHVSADDLDHLRGAPSLRALAVTGPDETLSRLRFLTRLESLHLLDKRVTDGGLRFLREMGNLKELDIENSEIGDAALTRIGALRQLEKLRLDSDKLTGIGFRNLSELTNLRSLDLKFAAGESEHYVYHCDDPQTFNLGLMAWLKNISGLERFIVSAPISDEVLALLSNSKRLRSLTIEDASGLTDAAVARLADLTDLKVLILHNCRQVSDAGIEPLRRLTKLELLDIDGAAITDRGLKSLQTLSRLENLALLLKRVKNPALLRQFPRLRLIYVEDRGIALRLEKTLPDCLALESNTAESQWDWILDRERQEPIDSIRRAP